MYVPHVKCPGSCEVARLGGPHKLVAAGGPEPSPGSVIESAARLGISEGIVGPVRPATEGRGELRFERLEFVRDSAQFGAAAPTDGDGLGEVGNGAARLLEEDGPTVGWR